MHYSAKAEDVKAAAQSFKKVGGKRGHDHQVVQIKEEEQSDSDSEDDKQNVEEGSDSGSDSDSGDDEAAKKEQKKAQETTPKTEDKKEAQPVQSLPQARSFGRDANGDYLDQKSYVKKRNELNQKEQTHRSMYESVTEKLDDPVYVQNAL